METVAEPDFLAQLLDGPADLADADVMVSPTRSVVGARTPSSPRFTFIGSSGFARVAYLRVAHFKPVFMQLGGQIFKADGGPESR